MSVFVVWPKNGKCVLITKTTKIATTLLNKTEVITIVYFHKQTVRHVYSSLCGHMDIIWCPLSCSQCGEATWVG